MAKTGWGGALAVALVALVSLLGACRRAPAEKLQVAETALEGTGGILLPGGTFLCLETWERDEYRLDPKAPRAALDLYRGIVSEGQESEAPPEVLGHRKLAATARLVRVEPGGAGALPLVPDLYRYDYAVCQGLLRNARQTLFVGAGSDGAGRAVCLPLWSSGSAAADEDWALLYLENGALTTVPRPGRPARKLAAPLEAASVTAARPDRRVDVRLAPDGRCVASVGRNGALEVAALDGRPLQSSGRRVWSCAWHPRLERLYLTSESGLELLDPANDTARPFPLTLPGGGKASSVEPSPSGRLLLLVPTGGRTTLFCLPLDEAGAPAGEPRLLPLEAGGGALRVWDPGERDFLWCFDTVRGEAFLVDAAAGRLLATWEWDRSKIELTAAQTSPDLPTLTIRYAAPGFPSWQRFTAWLDPATMQFVGVTEKPPIPGIQWRMADADVGGR